VSSRHIQIHDQLCIVNCEGIYGEVNLLDDVNVLLLYFPPGGEFYVGEDSCSFIHSSNLYKIKINNCRFKEQEIMKNTSGDIRRAILRGRF